MFRSLILIALLSATAPSLAQRGKPYLIDAQVARVGVAWADKPWTPSLKS